MPLVRTNITLPAETLAIIDEVAGPRGRSAYIAEVLLRQAKRDRMKKVWEENRGVLKGSTTWGTTPEEVLETLKEIRRSWDRPHVDALWEVGYVSTTPEAAAWAGEARRQRGAASPRNLGDALIAGVAWSLGATVVTRNPDDFVRMGVPVLAYEAEAPA